MAEVIRYGIIGTGMMGCEHIRNIMEIDGAKVMAISDPDERSRGWGILCAAKIPSWRSTRITARCSSGRPSTRWWSPRRTTPTRG